ncbi:hypothetical protein FVQ98_08960, partial [Ottowia sp. GY511]
MGLARRSAIRSPRRARAARSKISGCRPKTRTRAFVLFRSFFEMAKEKFERKKPHVNVGTIGHVDH